MVQHVLAALVTLLAFAGCTPATYETNGAGPGQGSPVGGEREAGSLIFAANCQTCHGAAGIGGAVGPSLRGESQRMTYGGLVSWIEDPEPPMPVLYPKFLTESEVRDVAAYVGSL